MQDPRIAVFDIGMRTKPEIDANLKIVADDTTYTTEDRALLAEYSAKLYETDAIKRLRTEQANRRRRDSHVSSTHTWLCAVPVRGGRIANHRPLVTAHKLAEPEP